MNHDHRYCLFLKTFIYTELLPTGIVTLGFPLYLEFCHLLFQAWNLLKKLETPGILTKPEENFMFSYYPFNVFTK